MKEKDRQTLLNIIFDYSKNNKFPFYEKVISSDEIYKSIFKDISKKEYYQLFLKDYIERVIDSYKQTKMGKLFKSFYDEHTQLFLEFAVANINKDFSGKFQDVGNKIKPYLTIMENQQFENMERSPQFKGFVGGTQKRYEFFLECIFPYYKNIGVVTKKN